MRSTRHDKVDEYPCEHRILGSRGTKERAAQSNARFSIVSSRTQENRVRTRNPCSYKENIVAGAIRRKIVGGQQRRRSSQHVLRRVGRSGRIPNAHTSCSSGEHCACGTRPPAGRFPAGGCPAVTASAGRPLKSAGWSDNSRARGRVVKEGSSLLSAETRPPGGGGT